MERLGTCDENYQWFLLSPVMFFFRFFSRMSHHLYSSVYWIYICVCTCMCLYFHIRLHPPSYVFFVLQPMWCPSFVPSGDPVLNGSRETYSLFFGEEFSEGFSFLLFQYVWTRFSRSSHVLPFPLNPCQQTDSVSFSRTLCALLFIF